MTKKDKDLTKLFRQLDTGNVSTKASGYNYPLAKVAQWLRAILREDGICDVVTVRTVQPNHQYYKLVDL